MILKRPANVITLQRQVVERRIGNGEYNGGKSKTGLKKQYLRERKLTGTYPRDVWVKEKISLSASPLCANSRLETDANER
jgi:hypothetical protein